MARIFFIDDMKSIQDSVAFVLERDGHTVICPDTPADAFEKLKTTPCDVIVTDMLMPDYDGHEMIEQARKFQPEAKILAISGGGESVPADKALLLAKTMADAALMKPFSKDVLRETINSLLAGE